MRKLLLLCLALTACGADSATAPPAPGTTAVSLNLPGQSLAVDGSGNQADVERITLSLGTPMLLGPSCPNGCAATSSKPVIVLKLQTGGDDVQWATWASTPGSYTGLRVPFVLHQGDSGDLRSGTSLAFGGVFEGVAATAAQYYGAYIVQLPVVTSVDLPLPARSDTGGVRYTVRVNTDSLLLDMPANRLIDIPRLVGNSPTAADVATVTRRLRAALTVSRQN